MASHLPFTCVNGLRDLASPLLANTPPAFRPARQPSAPSSGDTDTCSRLQSRRREERSRLSEAGVYMMRLAFLLFLRVPSVRNARNCSFRRAGAWGKSPRGGNRQAENPQA